MLRSGHPGPINMHLTRFRGFQQEDGERTSYHQPLRSRRPLSPRFLYERLLCWRIMSRSAVPS